MDLEKLMLGGESVDKTGGGGSEIRVEYSERYDEWDVDSQAPKWIHTAEPTREQAIQTARRMSDPKDTILIKGPRMSSFKRL